MTKKIIAALTVLCMVFALCPFGAFAQGASKSAEAPVRANARYDEVSSLTAGESYIFAVDNGDGTVTALANVSNSIAAVTLVKVVQYCFQTAGKLRTIKNF